MTAAPTDARRKAILALAILGLIWGYNWVTMKQAMLDSGPLNFSALRFGIGALTLVPVMMFMKDRFAFPAANGAPWRGSAFHWWRILVLS